MARIRIYSDRWTFMRNRNGAIVASASYRLVLHPHRVHVWLDGMRPTSQEPYMLGIVRRVGDTVQVLYRFRGSRPDSFENPPDYSWRITLRRRS